MKTYLILSQTNYGEICHIINADDEDEAKDIAENNENIWTGYELRELDTATKGVVNVVGGDIG